MQRFSTGLLPAKPSPKYKPATKGRSQVSPTCFSTSERRTHSPQFQRWSLELQQALGANTYLSFGYFGHHGIHELTQNPNANAYGFGSLPTALCTSPPVPPCADPRFSGVTQINTNAISNYNGMVVSFKHQFTRWTHGIFQANYTYGHALDEISNGGVIPYTGVTILSAQDPEICVATTGRPTTISGTPSMRVTCGKSR